MANEQMLASLPPRFDARRLADVHKRDATEAERLRHETRRLALAAHIDRVQTRRPAWPTGLLFARCMSYDGLIALAIEDAGPMLSGLANDLLLACYGGRFRVAIRTQVETAKGEA